MKTVTDTWYVLADGTHADPKDVSADDDGVLRHKNGVPVALREGGLPLTSGVATRENKRAAEAGEAPAGEVQAPPGDGGEDATDAKAKPKGKNREIKAGDDQSADYKTR